MTANGNALTVKHNNMTNIDKAIKILNTLLADADTGNYARELINDAIKVLQADPMFGLVMTGHVEYRYNEKTKSHDLINKQTK